MKFPACQHARPKAAATAASGLRWLAEEPFRVFFFSGALWSAAGVLLWPLFQAGGLGFYPSLAHARLMIEAFGGAFVAGFLATAGPRMASAPKLTRAELVWLFSLHQAGAFCHLRLHHAWGDGLFALLLASLLLALAARVVRFRREPPPPQLLLALLGLLCGIAGAAMLALPAMAGSPEAQRLASLLLYQGLLLPPTLGIGSFIFPRMLGGGFGEPRTPAEARTKRRRVAAAAGLLLASFFIEAWGHPLPGCLLRAAVAAGYLLLEVRWRKQPGDPERGTLAAGMRWALGSGLAGLLLAAFFPAQRVSVEHLLYAGGFGLLMLMVGSRVLFGHSGELAAFAQRSKWARFLIFLGLLAAATRAVTGFLPQLTASHHFYAALTWALLALLWLGWHRKRFVKREMEPER